MKTLSDEEKAALQKQIDKGRADRKERSERITSGSKFAQRYEQQTDRPDQPTMQVTGSSVEINGKQYELAPWWQRLRAQVLDWAVVAPIPGVPIVVLRLITGHALGRLLRSGPAGFAMVVALYAMVVVLFALALLYMACGDGLRNGQSYGSRWTGLQVIDKQTGEPCTFQQSVSRFAHSLGGRGGDPSNTVVVRVPVASRP